MSDARFARLKTDPRFRRPNKRHSKAIPDDRFKHKEEDANDLPTTSTIVDYARGAVLMESSDEEDDRDPPPHVSSDDENDVDQGGFVSISTAHKKLEREEVADVTKTRRLAVVNLDWGYVRAVHLYKIFSSVNVASGKILSVRVYPSEFGRTRMAKEEKQGPPMQVFRKRSREDEDEDINETTIFETGTEADYDEDALREYQLERLRYYYAIVECDTVETAVHLYNELDGTELERSANVFDLSFVPDDMVFDDEPRDETAQLSDAPYKAVEFVTDALRHSKVKLTWDEDDPERNRILRRTLTKKEIDELDFRAYVASASSSEGDSEDDYGEEWVPKDTGREKTKNEAKSSKSDRDKLRKLLLSGNDDELPEGWGDAFDNKASRREEGRTGGGEAGIDITFMPGLSETKISSRSKIKSRNKKKRSQVKDADDEPEDTDDFVIDVKDDRFAAIHEDHHFSIDPMNPQFKKTKSMAALLSERSKRQKSKTHSDRLEQSRSPIEQNGHSLHDLVESVKRKSAAVGGGEFGKRQKLGKSSIRSDKPNL